MSSAVGPACRRARDLGSSLSLTADPREHQLAYSALSHARNHGLMGNHDGVVITNGFCKSNVMTVTAGSPRVSESPSNDSASLSKIKCPVD